LDLAVKALSNDDEPRTLATLAITTHRMRKCPLPPKRPSPLNKKHLGIRLHSKKLAEELI
jgi:hypothetical protein